MNMKLFLPLGAAAVVALFTGCATDAHYVQTGDREQIVSLDQINIQDYANAANAAVKDLLQSGALDRVPNPPAVLVVSPIINQTSQQVETDLLTHKITKALLDSGKAMTMTKDQAVMIADKKRVFATGASNMRAADFTLSGKIIETVDRAGKTRRTTYSFQLSLNSYDSGLQVWEGEKEIGKQGTRNSVGF